MNARELLVGLVFTLIFPFSGCQRSAPPPAPPPPPTVTVSKPAKQAVVEWDEYTGRLEAVESVEVRARVGGLVVATPFVEGSVVSQGDLLVEIDPRPFQAELESRLADQASAAASVVLAEIEFRRISSIPSEARTDMEQDTAAARLDQARAQHAATGAAVEIARLNVEWCQVRAPISGRVSSKYVTQGNLITGGDGVGTLLTTITSIDPIYCYIDVDERSVLKYQRLSREGARVSARDSRMACYLQLSNETGFPHEGVLDFVDNRIDPATGTIRARGTFPNPSGWLTPGFFGRVRIPGSGHYEAVLVPDAAISSSQNQKQVLIVDEDDVIQVRPVQVGALFGEMRAIRSGLEGSERLVLTGQMRVRPGMKVSTREAKQGAPPVARNGAVGMEAPTSQPDIGTSSSAGATRGAAQ